MLCRDCGGWLCAALTAVGWYGGCRASAAKGKDESPGISKSVALRSQAVSTKLRRCGVGVNRALS